MKAGLSNCTGADAAQNRGGGKSSTAAAAVNFTTFINFNSGFARCGRK
jgi:hypothetical protein